MVRKKMKFKAKANFFNLLSFKKKKKKERKKESCNKSVKLHFHYSTTKYDDSITGSFPFSKEILPKNKILCLNNAWKNLRKFS